MKIDSFYTKENKDSQSLLQKVFDKIVKEALEKYPKLRELLKNRDKNSGM